MNNHYAKFEYKRSKKAGVTDYTTLTPPMHFGWEKCLSSTSIKMRNYLSNVCKMRGAHLECMNTHYAKFENKEMNTVGVTYYTNQTPSKHIWIENV